MLPIAPILDSMGFSAQETWGGATIDAGLRFLKEWPFDRLDALKKAAPKTPHMMLLRGQNIVGYTNYADDVVEAFVAMSAQARHEHLPHFRLRERPAQPGNLHPRRQESRSAGPRHHLLHDFSRAHHADFCGHGAGTRGYGSGRHRHQGYGRPHSSVCHPGTRQQP